MTSVDNSLVTLNGRLNINKFIQVNLSPLRLRGEPFPHLYKQEDDLLSVRSNCWVALAFFVLSEWLLAKGKRLEGLVFGGRAIFILRDLIDLLAPHLERKLTFLKQEGRPNIFETWKCLHQKYHLDGQEVVEYSWPWLQEDIYFIGFLIGKLYQSGREVVKTGEQARFLQNIVDYAQVLGYGPDFGSWEEKCFDLRASSVASKIASLERLRVLPWIKISDNFIREGADLFWSLFPYEISNENCSREVDLAQIISIYPLELVRREKAKELIERVESNLERNEGLARFPNDKFVCPSGWALLSAQLTKLGDIGTATSYFEEALEHLNLEGKVESKGFSLPHAVALFIIAACLTERVYLF